jgi:hypothetical protein
VSATRRIMLLLGTAIGIGMAVTSDVSLSRRAERATVELAAIALHKPEEQQLAKDISRYLDARKELNRRTAILARMSDPTAFRSPTAAMCRTLAWGDEREVDINGLLLEDGELEAIVATAEPGVAVALARDLVARGLIEFPEVRWTRPGSPTGLRWLGVSGRLAPPSQKPAPIPCHPVEFR